MISHENCTHRPTQVRGKLIRHSFVCVLRAGCILLNMTQSMLVVKALQKKRQMESLHLPKKKNINQKLHFRVFIPGQTSAA